MRRFGLAGLLIGGLLLGGVGVTAYQMGVAAGTTSAAVAAGATVVYAAPGMGFGFGFPIFGLFFGLLFLALVVGFFKRLAWARSGGPGGRGGPGFGPGRGPWMLHGAMGHGGPGAWGPGTERSVPPFVDEMLVRWHAQAHGTTGAAPTGQAGSTAQAPSDGPTGSAQA